MPLPLTLSAFGLELSNIISALQTEMGSGVKKCIRANPQAIICLNPPDSDFDSLYYKPLFRLIDGLSLQKTRYPS
jgi:hypothetical protein